MLFVKMQQHQVRMKRVQQQQAEIIDALKELADLTAPGAKSE
jgi:hypothetical protein